MCSVCDDTREKVGDFNGKTYFEVRVTEYFGFPAALFVFRGPTCIAGYGIYACPGCGRVFREGDDAC